MPAFSPLYACIYEWAGQEKLAKQLFLWNNEEGYYGSFIARVASAAWSRGDRAAGGASSGQFKPLLHRCLWIMICNEEKWREMWAQEWEISGAFWKQRNNVRGPAQPSARTRPHSTCLAWHTTTTFSTMLYCFLMMRLWFITCFQYVMMAIKRNS